ncbi:hypothetical protein ASE25_11410 [Terrabacter sp. Root85]|uniref:hypothetical protein n=1 Tax=Terrabacter sp. Root85 TaxID=1736603 RepID=UPI000701AF8C|nr:hypothetical protein [Terrabacter sp. Root85]KRC90089.1 hypothetical protein ASE25_11410 [Terrabacter sp. Root85]
MGTLSDEVDIHQGVLAFVEQLRGSVLLKRLDLADVNTAYVRGEHPTVVRTRPLQRAGLIYATLLNMPESKGRSKGVEVAGTAAGAAVGALLGGPVGGIIGAAITPGTIELVGRAWDEIVGRQQANGAAVVQIASDQSGVDLELFVQEVLNNPSQRALFKNAVQAGANAGDEEKIRALATCLANGFDDGTKADYELLIVKALASLDPVHVRVLATAHANPSGDVTVRKVTRLLFGTKTRDEDLSPDVSRPVLSVLEREGLIQEKDPPRLTVKSFLTRVRNPEIRPWDPGTTYEVTLFGVLCLQRLGFSYFSEAAAASRAAGPA